METNLKQKTFEGIRWNFQSQILAQGFNFIIGIIMMRLLAPENFGNFAMVLVVFNFFQIFRDSGLSQAIIQQENLSKEKVSTAFFHQFFVAGIIALLLFQGQFIFEWIYNTQSLTPLIFWFSLDFFIGSIGLIPTALIKRALDFKKLFYLNFISLLVSSSIGLIMAWYGFGIMSLVIKLLLWTTINSFGSYFLCSQKPDFTISKRAFKILIDFGLPASGNQLISYIVRNVDDFFIGKVLGSASLGLYNRAYAIMLLPMGSITNVLQNVFTSTWSRMKDEAQVVKANYLKLTGLIALVAFPAMILIAVQATPIIALFFGTQWLEMSTTLSILCIIGMMQSVGSLIGILFLVYDKNKQLFVLNIFSSLFTIAILTATIYYFKTIEATALSYGIVSIILIFPSFYFGGKIINASIIEMIEPTLVPMFLSILCGIISYLIFNNIEMESDWIKLALSLFIPCLVYLSFFHLTQANVWKDLLVIIDTYKSSNHG